MKVVIPTALFGGHVGCDGFFRNMANGAEGLRNDVCVVVANDLPDREEHCTVHGREILWSNRPEVMSQRTHATVKRRQVDVLISSFKVDGIISDSGSRGRV